MPIYNARMTSIDPIETRRYAGLAKAQDFSDAAINAACEEASLLLEVRGIWNMYEYDAERQVIRAEPSMVIEGKAIGKHLSTCERVVCMAVTVGDAIEREVTGKFRSGGYVDAMLLDAAATTAVEQAADQLELAIKQTVEREGFTMRSRYSPGYGDWDLSAQRELFRLCGASEIGMKLSTAMMLMPRKSVTAVIGLTRKGDRSERALGSKHDCSTCDKLDCPLRS